MIMTETRQALEGCVLNGQDCMEPNLKWEFLGAHQGDG